MTEYYVLVFIHVLAGALWVGGVALAGFFIIPAVVEAGPGGGAVMGGMVRRKYPQVMTVLAILTVLAGLRLYGIRLGVTGGGMAWATSKEGLVLGLGAVLALGGFAIGLMVQKPTAQKIGALGAEIAKAGKPSPEQAAAMQALQLKLLKAGRLQAWHLLAALILMACHRLVATF